MTASSPMPYRAPARANRRPRLTVGFALLGLLLGAEAAAAEAPFAAAAPELVPHLSRGAWAAPSPLRSTLLPQGLPRARSLAPGNSGPGMVLTTIGGVAVVMGGIYFLVGGAAELDGMSEYGGLAFKGGLPMLAIGIPLLKWEDSLRSR